MPAQGSRIIGGRTPTRPQRDVAKVEGRKPVASAPANRTLRATPGTRRDVPRALRAKINVWPPESKAAAYSTIDEYGVPQESTPTHLVWYKNGPWKRTIVWRDGHEHEFPSLHRDVLEQVVDFEPPLDKFDEIGRFNGSLTLSRTRGELACRCDAEATNFLMANLANDVATEVRTLEEARAYVAEKILSRRSGEPDDYLVGLRFAVDVGDVGDPDEDVVGSTSSEAEEMGRDAQVGARGRTTARPRRRARAGGKRPRTPSSF
jgi:hypothetical protein